MVKNIEKFYDEAFVKSAVHTIARQMYRDGFYPDCIVGITRGGLIPGVLLSHYLDIPFYALNKDESNLWLSEEAFGYEYAEDGVSRSNPSLRKNILLIDDINDTGTTFRNIIKDWQSSCGPDDTAWKDIWNNTVKFATLIDNESSDQTIDYSGISINKAETPEWCVFPWERWW